MTYSPFAHLRALPHVTLGFHELGAISGLYFADLKAIVLQKGLLQVERRCTLAHELAHHRLGHTSCYDRKANRLQEAEAESVASRWLIPMESYVAARLWSIHVCEQADEAWVDARMWHARSESLTREERRTVEERLAARDGAA